MTLITPDAVGVPGRQELQLALLGVRPNPARELVVEFELPAWDAGEIQVFDLAGRKQAAREIGSLGPGRHRISIRRGLRPGIYWVRLSWGGQRITRKAVLVR